MAKRVKKKVKKLVWYRNISTSTYRRTIEQGGSVLPGAKFQAYSIPTLFRKKFIKLNTDEIVKLTNKNKKLKTIKKDTFEKVAIGDDFFNVINSRTKEKMNITEPLHEDDADKLIESFSENENN